MSNQYSYNQNQGPQMAPSAPYAPPNQATYPPPQQASQYDQYNQQAQGPAGYQQNTFSGNGKFNDEKMALAPNDFQGERFKPEKPKFRDPIFAIFFLLVFGGFIALSVISLRTFFSVGGSLAGTNGRGGTAPTGIGSTLNRGTALLLLICCGCALALSTVYILMVRFMTTIILEVTLALSVLVNIAYCILLWVRGFTSAAIIFTIFAVFSIVAYFFMRKRIPLAKLMLKTIIRASDQYPSAYVVAMLGLIFQTAFSIWWAYTLVATYQRFEPGTPASGSSASSGTVTGLVVFLVFAWYYLSEVFKNIAFVTVAGIYGAWYYAPPSGEKVKHAALSSFKRATTYSLGSIAFGSLIVALLDILRAVLSVIQSTEASQGDMVGATLACVAGCCVGCVDSLVQYFNRYAYIEISLYGSSYITAAKDTWRLLRQKGIDALINDSLVNIVWTIGSYVIGVLTALLAYVVLRQTQPTYVGNESSYYAVIVLYAFGLAVNIALALGSGSIGSGVSVLFVGLGENPELLATRDPELFAAFQSAYPDVVRPVV